MVSDQSLMIFEEDGREEEEKASQLSGRCCWRFAGGGFRGSAAEFS